MTVRNALNRETYVDAALQVIDDVGVDKLSMRNVASRLNVSAMAVYKHFPAKDDLLAAALEEFIARAGVIPDNNLPWDRWVEEAARGMYEALCRELSWVPLLGTLRLGPQAAAVTDAFVKKLCVAGFTTEQALRAYFAVLQIVVGAVCLRASIAAGQGGRKKAGADVGVSRVIRGYLQEIDSERLRIAPVLDTVLKCDPIEIGLPLLIHALRAQLAEAVE